MDYSGYILYSIVAPALLAAMDVFIATPSPKFHFKGSYLVPILPGYFSLKEAMTVRETSAGKRTLAIGRMEIFIFVISGNPDHLILN